jgi:uncharacterized protein (DUF433 family)
MADVLQPVQIDPSDLVTASSRRLGGEPVFAGTRVPVRALFDHLAAGDTLERFVDDFPDVTHDRAVAVLRSAQAALVALVPVRD